MIMARKIVITSGKGGVGKTTIVSLLGVSLASKGYKVLIVDMDFGLNNLDVVMGIENKIVYDIIDVLEGKCQPRQAIIQDFWESNLYIFPSTHGFCRVKFGGKELSAIIENLQGMFDFVIIDCPAGMDGGFRRAVECADEYIVVTTPHLSAVRDADKVIRAIVSTFQSVPYIAINRARGDLMLDGNMLDVSTIEEYLSGELIAVIPESDDISIQMYKGCRVDVSLDIYQSLHMMADNIIFGKKELFDCKKKYKGIIGGLRKKIRRKL